MLRDEQTTHDLPADESGFVIARRTDALGRSEAGLTHTRFDVVEGAHEPSLPGPTWPTDAGWALDRRGGALRALVAWDTAVDALPIVHLELITRDSLGHESVAAAPVPSGLNYHVVADAPWPASAVDFRWRITDAHGRVMHTPWSAPVEPTGPATLSLTLAEDLS